jgi:hypothetical protein
MELLQARGEVTVDLDLALQVYLGKDILADLDITETHTAVAVVVALANLDIAVAVITQQVKLTLDPALGIQQLNILVYKWLEMHLAVMECQ